MRIDRVKLIAEMARQDVGVADLSQRATVSRATITACPMFIYTLYTLTGETLGQTPLLEQAMRTARAYAAVRRVSCVVECRRLDTDEARRVLLNADGSMVKLWQAA